MIRVVLDTNTFELKGSWDHVADLNLPDGLVFVGGWENFDTAEPRHVQPGKYAVDRWQGLP